MVRGPFHINNFTILGKMYNERAENTVEQLICQKAICSQQPLIQFREARNPSPRKVRDPGCSFGTFRHILSPDNPLAKTLFWIMFTIELLPKRHRFL